MKKTMDSKMGGVRKAQSFAPKEMAGLKAADGALREGHHKLSGSLMDELRGGGMAMDGDDEQNEAAEMENVSGQKKKQMKSSQDYTRMPGMVKQGPNKSKGFKNGKGY